jgi:cytosine/adenosine deaminase-related metal-dependent hydrolase
MTRAHRATWTFLDGAFRAGMTVVVRDDGVISEVRVARDDDPAAHQGLLVPGLVNAHTHLELSWIERPIEGDGRRLSTWVGRMMDVLRDVPPEAERSAAARRAADAMFASGTAGVCDVGNAGDTAEAILEAGLSGIVEHERLGMDARRLPERIADARVPDREVASGGRRVVVRPAPHAPYSTAPALIRACVGRPVPGRAPSSIHLAEDRDEVRFLSDGSGPWATFLDRLGHEWRWWEPPGCTPVAYVESLDVLGPGLLVVHAVHTTPADRALLARRRAPVCLCPRSNLHIGGELPDVQAMLADGVHLCVGTDSGASSPDLDVFGELVALAAAFPDVPWETWLGLATDGGARALGLSHLGRLEPGRAPGLLLLENVEPRIGAFAADRRRWLDAPGDARE